MNNLELFNAQLDHFTNVIMPAQHVKLVKKITITFYNLCVRQNSMMHHHPFDTGWAVGNWRVSVISRPTNVLGSKQKPPKPRTKAQLTNQLQAFRPYRKVYVYNNVPYMGKLESGTSTTAAPFGIVGPALIDLESMIQSGKF